MNISGSFGEVDKVGFAQPRQASIDSVEQIVSRDRMLRQGIPSCHTVSLTQYDAVSRIQNKFGE